MWAQQKAEPAARSCSGQSVCLHADHLHHLMLAHFPAGLGSIGRGITLLSIIQQWAIMRSMGVKALSAVDALAPEDIEAGRLAVCRLLRFCGWGATLDHCRYDPA